MNDFLKRLMAAAGEADIEACEAYIVERDSFRAMVTEGEVTEYNTNATRGLGFRGLKNGRMGYASTEAFDDAAVEQLVRGASLIGKGADVLMKIDRVGRDMQMAQGMCGSMSGSVPTNVGEPMIRVSAITVGGRA